MRHMSTVRALYQHHLSTVRDIYQVRAIYQLRTFL